jgi:transcriptional regulator with XRE-family HTH domain
MLHTGSMVTRMQPDLQARIVEEIRVILTRRRMSAGNLARQIGWSESQISRKFAGQAKFTITDLEKVAVALDVPVADFLPSSRDGFITPAEWKLVSAA